MIVYRSGWSNFEHVRTCDLRLPCLPWIIVYHVYHVSVFSMSIWLWKEPLDCICAFSTSFNKKWSGILKFTIWIFQTSERFLAGPQKLLQNVARFDKISQLLESLNFCHWTETLKPDMNSFDKTIGVSNTFPSSEKQLGLNI